MTNSHKSIKDTESPDLPGTEGPNIDLFFVFDAFGSFSGERIET